MSTEAGPETVGWVPAVLTSVSVEVLASVLDLSLRMCEKVSSVTCRRSVVSSTRKLISSSFHRLDMTLAVAEALNP